MNLEERIYNIEKQLKISNLLKSLELYHKLGIIDDDDLRNQVIELVRMIDKVEED